MKKDVEPAVLLGRFMVLITDYEAMGISPARSDARRRKRLVKSIAKPLSKVPAGKQRPILELLAAEAHNYFENQSHRNATDAYLAVANKSARRTTKRLFR